MELDTVAKVKAAWHRLAGATSADPALVLNGESADDVAYQYLTRGCRVAQRWMLKCGYQGWRKRSAALVFSGTDAADGGKYVALPDDFLRAYGNGRKSALTNAGGERWGTEVPTNDEEAHGDGYYLRGSQIWLLRGAGTPATLYLDYHYQHPLWSALLTPIDFPLEARFLIPTEAAELAMGEEWWPGDEKSEEKLERALMRAREEARDVARQTKQPRQMRKPFRLGNRY